MTCYYYKMVVRKTGEEFNSNFDWSDRTPEKFMEERSSRVFKCVIISKEEFDNLRKLGK